MNTDIYRTTFDDAWLALTPELYTPLSALTVVLPMEAHVVGHDIFPVREISSSVDTFLKRNSRIMWGYEHDLLYVAKHKSRSKPTR